MGTKCCAPSGSKRELNSKEENIINKLNFIKRYPIGKGGFNRVNKIIIIIIIFINIFLNIII